MRWLVMMALLMGGVDAARAQSTPRQDALVQSYFAIWDNDAGVTMDNVRRLYAPQVNYFGHTMTRDEVLADKRAFIRRWPMRRYEVEPGSASKRCDAGAARCTLSADLVWRARGAVGARSGRWRVRLELARVDGGLKIVREAGSTIGR